MTRFARLRQRLRNDTKGLALIEFALGTPLILLAGGWGAELSSYGLCQLKVSQYALSLADNASRVGQVASNGVSTLRETDLNDVLQATKVQGEGLDLTTNGRIILSSLENVAQDYDDAPTQRIHWQRCIGLRKGAGYDSGYGGPTSKKTAGAEAPAGYVASADDQYAGATAPTGMGDAGAKVIAPKDSGVMFVEINYEYKPIFGSMFMSPTRVHYIASYMVRDNRDFTRISNPKPTATASTCDLYSAGPVTLNKF